MAQAPAGRLHFWLAPPKRSQRCTRVPFLAAAVDEVETAAGREVHERAVRAGNPLLVAGALAGAARPQVDGAAVGRAEGRDVEAGLVAVAQGAVPVVRP